MVPRPELGFQTPWGPASRRERLEATPPGARADPHPCIYLDYLFTTGLTAAVKVAVIALLILSGEFLA